MTLQKPLYRLVILEGPDQGKIYALDTDTITLGRQSGNRIVIDSPQVSRSHARLVRQGSAYVLQDLGSANGTYVNQSRVTGSTTLKVGDHIDLGLEVRLLFTSQPDVGDQTIVAPPPTNVGAAVVKQPVPPTPAPAPVTSPGSNGPAARSPRRGRSRGCLVLTLVGLPSFLCLCLLAGLTYNGVHEYLAAPKQISGVIIPEVSAPSYALGPDQRDYVDNYGYPDSFIILFYDSQDEEHLPTRFETWIYSLAGLEVTFVNGQLETEAAIPPLDGGLYAAPYKPESFVAYMSLDEVLAATRLDELLLLPLEKELVEGGESFFADQLTFGLKDDQLRYVEAMALQYLPGEAGSAPEAGAVGEGTP